MVSVHTIVLEWVFCMASLFILLVRIHVRTRIVKVGMQREEYMLIAAQVLFFCWVSMDTFTASQGFMNQGMDYRNLPQGFHVPDYVKVRVLKVVYSSSVPYYICLWLIKFALLSLYYRLIPKRTKTRIVLHVTAALALISSIVIICVNLFLCVPISSNWNPKQTAHSCYASTSVPPFLISVLLNFVVDILIFALPFSVIRKLKTIGRKQKLGLIATFSVGILTLVIIIVRVVIIVISGSISIAAILTAMECFTSMAVACMPVMRPLFKTKINFRFPRRNRRRRRNDNSSSGKLADGRYRGEEDDEDDENVDLESTISYNEHGYHKSVPLTRLEKPVPDIPHSQTSVVETPAPNNDYQNGEDDYSYSGNSPTSSPALLQQVRLQHEQELLHANQQGTMHYPMPQYPHPSHNIPSYVSRAPLPIPPPPNSQNHQEYIVPSYILNEPLPNPVI